MSKYIRVTTVKEENSGTFGSEQETEIEIHPELQTLDDMVKLKTEKMSEDEFSIETELEDGTEVYDIPSEFIKEVRMYFNTSGNFNPSKKYEVTEIYTKVKGT